MKIRKITLSKYKRFQSLTIDLGDNPKRIVALVGPNGCGKSSVFDGMLFLNNAYGGIGNKGNKDFHYHSIEQKIKGTRIFITIQLNKTLHMIIEMYLYNS